MTITEARKVLGKSAEGITDQEIQRDIETAQFLADIVMPQLLKMTSVVNNGNA